jgi:hypothetical protein
MTLESRHNRRVSDKALKALRCTVKQRTRRMLGVSFRSLMSGLSKTLLGWGSYYGFSEVPTPLQELESGFVGVCGAIFGSDGAG